jgi:hypothetical protein
MPVHVYADSNTNGSLDVGTDAPVAEYRYDGLRRRIRKIVEGQAQYDYYYNESWQVLEVRKDSDPDPYEQYVWDVRYIDAPVLRWRDGNTDGDLEDEGDDTLYYCNDANMNVTALVNTSGTVVERYLYDPYGKPTITDASWSAITWAGPGGSGCSAA